MKKHIQFLKITVSAIQKVDKTAQTRSKILLCLEHGKERMSSKNQQFSSTTLEIITDYSIVTASTKEKERSVRR